MTAILNGAAPFNLNVAREAAAREAGREPFRFVYGEDEFSIPALDEWPVQVEVHLAAGALSAALAELLGKQMDAFMANSPTFGDIRILLEQVGTWAGVDGLGNSGAPQLPASTQT